METPDDEKVSSRYHLLPTPAGTGGGLGSVMTSNDVYPLYPFSGLARRKHWQEHPDTDGCCHSVSYALANRGIDYQEQNQLDSVTEQLVSSYSQNVSSPRQAVRAAELAGKCNGMTVGMTTASSDCRLMETSTSLVVGSPWALTQEGFFIH